MIDRTYRRHPHTTQPLHRVQASGFQARGLRFRAPNLGFRVQGSGCRVQGAGCRVQGAGFPQTPEPKGHQQEQLDWIPAPNPNRLRALRDSRATAPELVSAKVSFNCYHLIGATKFTPPISTITSTTQSCSQFRCPQEMHQRFAESMRCGD